MFSHLVQDSLDEPCGQPDSFASQFSYHRCKLRDLSPPLGLYENAQASFDAKAEPFRCQAGRSVVRQHQSGFSFYGQPDRRRLAWIELSTQKVEQMRSRIMCDKLCPFRTTKLGATGKLVSFPNDLPVNQIRNEDTPVKKWKERELAD